MRTAPRSIELTRSSSGYRPRYAAVTAAAAASGALPAAAAATDTITEAFSKQLALKPTQEASVSGVHRNAAATVAGRGCLEPAAALHVRVLACSEYAVLSRLGFTIAFTSGGEGM